MSPYPITAVIVTYQSARTIGATLAAVRRCYEAQLLDCVIVDNGSGDGTQEILQRESGWARVLLTGRNDGFGRGCNTGAAHVTSPYTLFLNPDASIEPSALRTLLEFLQNHPGVGIVGPATICGRDETATTLQKTGPLPAPRFTQAPRLSPIVPGAASFRTGWVCGAIFLVRTELMTRLGGFDPRFFLYFEETDVCRRAADLGFETWAVGTAVARHEGAASSLEDDAFQFGCIPKHYYQSRRYYMIKHHGWLRATLAETVEMMKLLAQTLADLLRGRGPSRIHQRFQAWPFSQPKRV